MHELSVAPRTPPANPAKPVPARMSHRLWWGIGKPELSHRHYFSKRRIGKMATIEGNNTQPVDLLVNRKPVCSLH